ncbi:MAG: hypothetical protein WKG07_07445 [Hymenobacter sp.]
MKTLPRLPSLRALEPDDLEFLFRARKRPRLVGRLRRAARARFAPRAARMLRQAAVDAWPKPGKCA